MFSVGQIVTVQATFSDSGKSDTHDCTINWGDTTTSKGTVSESNGSGKCTGSHTYGPLPAGTSKDYFITVTITDKNDPQSSGTSPPIKVTIFAPKK
jgi:hypothetical protein